MTTDRDLRRALDLWLAEGYDQVNDRVLDDVEEQIATQRQRHQWRLIWSRPMPPFVKPLAAAAAVIVLAVVGYSLLPGTSGTGGPATSPTPSAQPTATATAGPSAGAALPGWYTTSELASGMGILSAGSYMTTSFKPGLTFSVPAGWVNDGDEIGYFSLFPDTPANQAEFARSGRLAQSIVMGPHDSPWYFCQSVENNRGATAAEMVTAITANEALATSGLVDVEIGGLTGKMFDVRVNPDWTGTCPPQADDPPGMNLADERTRGLLLDAPGRGVIVMFVGSVTSADFDAFIAEAMPIVQSFQFDVSQ